MSKTERLRSEAQDLALEVSRLGRRLRQERKSDLTPTQFSVMGTLRILGPATPTEVALRERVSPPAATRTLNSLAEAGLIERRSHPTDGRQVHIVISTKGDRAMIEERARRNAWLEVHLARLSDADRSILVRAAAIMSAISSA